MEKQPDKTIRVIVLDEEKIFNLNDRCLYVNGEVHGKPLVGIPYKILEYLAINAGLYRTEDMIREGCKIGVDYSMDINQNIYKIRTAIEDYKENESSKEFTYIKCRGRGTEKDYSCTRRIVDMPISNLPGIFTPSVEACLSNNSEHMDTINYDNQLFDESSDNHDDRRSKFDIDQALKELIEKAENGDEDAKICAGACYFYGILGSGDFQKAASLFQEVSNLEGKNAAIANKFIARMYYSGSMPREEQSYEKSFKYHVKSAEGDMYSAGQVGFMLSIGSGCQFDYEKTEEYFSRIFDQLDNPRKNSLCRFYMSHGDFGKAAKIYAGMADEFPEAAYQLGLLYKRGVLNNPIMPNYREAEYYLRKALDNGYIAAAYELGTLYFNPTGSFKKDFKKAQDYYLIAAENGNDDAQYMLGYMYYYGHIGGRDLKKSLEYHEMAASQGHILSSAYLAVLYQIPEFEDYDKAFYYAQYAAGCGDTPSELVLGTLYLSGKGCIMDKNKAYLCFKHAAENGTPEAEFFLALIDKNEEGT